jgi:hypothetical protein
MRGIFINYRQDDSAAVEAVDLGLEGRFGADRVFRDIESMRPGEAYPQQLRAELEQADVLVALIGPRWLALTDENGRPRIMREGDWVRREIARALARRIAVVPVLVHPRDGRPVRPPERQDLPPEIQAFADTTVVHIHWDRMRADVDALAKHLIALVPGLLIGDLFTRPPDDLVPDNAPSTLLRPEYEVVTPFLPRHELGRLQSWVTSAPATSARLLTGPAGSGKTRLAQALCAELVSKKWLAGMLRAGPSAEQLRWTAEVDKPLLVVIDDGELRTEEADAVLTAFCERSATAHAPARLLLITRAGDETLRALRGHRDPRVAELFREGHGNAVIALPECPPDRAAHLAAAHEAFAGRLEMAGSAVWDGPAPDGSLLEVHSAALSRLLRRSNGSPARPIAEMVRHDRRHWRDRLRATGHQDASVDALGTVATIASLCRPASAEEAATLIDRLEVVAGGSRYSARHYVNWLAALFPGPYPLDAVQPDTLAEEIIAATVTAEPDLLVRLPDLATDAQLTRSLAALGRAMARYPELASAVTTLAGTDLDRLVGLGLDAVDAVPNSAPYQRALGQALHDHNASLDLVFGLLPRYATHLEKLSAFTAVTFPLWVKLFPKTLQQQARSTLNLPESKGLADVERAADRLTDFVVQALTHFIDKDTVGPPTAPDGTPLFPPLAVEALRKIWAYRRWLPDPK